MKFKHYHFTFITALFFAQIANSQIVKLTIRVAEANKKPIIGATVQLISRADSNLKYFAIADSAGIAQLNLKQGQYRIAISSVGFKSLSKGIVVAPQRVFFEYFLEPYVNDLQQITVTARKPLMTQEEDKTIVDPEPLANTSTSAYEVIEKTPGLFLDQDGNIFISSSTPATIYINGREQKMSATDIATMLKSLPPNSIEKMEIMRTPSAKYDASSSGGIVNIILKKGVKIGRTGSMTSGFNQGRFGNQFAGINLNNNDGGRTSYFNLNLTNRKSYDQIETNRRLSIDQILAQKAYTITPGQIIFSGFGMGFEPNSKWQLNLDGRGSIGNSQTNSTNDNTIKLIANNKIFSENSNSVKNETKNWNYTQGFVAKYKIDTLGSELTTDFSLGYFKNNNNQNYATTFIAPQKTDLLGNGIFDTKRLIFAAQADLKYKLPKNIVFESGIKITTLGFNSNTNFKVVVNGSELVDKFRTNQFNYSENINAGYLQGSKTINHFIIKIGARLENTNMDGHQIIPKDTTFSIKRTDLFPYVYLSRKIIKIAGYELRGFLVYRRTITRPVYDYLNPFPKFIDQYLYESGNPNLKPQFTENYEANISVEGMPIFAIGRNYTQDIFSQVVYQSAINQSIAIRTYDNLGKNKETYFRLLGALPPGGKYFFVLGTQYNLNDYMGLYENKPLTFRRGSLTFFTFHQLKVDKNSTLQLNGFLRLKGQQQFYELGNFGNLNLSINRAFINRKLMVTASISDVFYSNKNTFTINQGNISAFGLRKSDTRRFGLNIRYNFGFKKREERANPFDFNTMENNSK